MMSASTAGLLTATLAFSTVLAGGLVVGSAFDATAHVISESEIAARRIDGAFEAAGLEAEPTTGSVDCDAGVWPYIDASCLVSADGSHASSVRIVY